MLKIHDTKIIIVLMEKRFEDFLEGEGYGQNYFISNRYFPNYGGN